MSQDKGETGINLVSEWLKLATENVLVVRRHRHKLVDGTYKYADDPTIFPTSLGEKYRPLLIDTTEGKILPAVRELQWHNVIDENKIYYPEKQQYYPALLITENAQLGGDEIFVITYETYYGQKIMPEKRSSTMQFTMYFTPEIGKRLVSALKDGRIEPNVFINLYEKYFPDANNKPTEAIVGNNDKVLHLMEKQDGQKSTIKSLPFYFRAK